MLYLLALPILLLLSFKQKYKNSIPARFFLFNNNPLSQNHTWFHGCSLGEVASLKPLLKHFENVAITTTTQTGFEQAKKMTQNAKFLPYEIFLPFWIKKQSVLVVLEAELWYMLFFCAKVKKTNTVLLSARISDKSYKSYLKFQFLYIKIFENIDKVYAQSLQDKIRLQTLGAQNVEVAGNIKLANLPKVTTMYDKPKCLLITAASSHEKEEELVLQAFKDAKIKNAKLVIVPRHPERFESVARLIENKKEHFTFHRFSQRKDFDSDIVLIDMMGELNNIYVITDVTILCGAFEKIGGHNPIEPAFFNNKIISGEHYFNQKSTYKYIHNIQVTQNLTDTLKNHKDLKPATIEAKEFDLDKVIKGIKDASL